MLLSIYHRVEPKWSQCIRDSTNRYIQKYMRKHNTNQYNDINENLIFMTDDTNTNTNTNNNNKNNNKHIMFFSFVSIFSFLAGYHCKRITL